LEESRTACPLLLLTPTDASTFKDVEATPGRVMMKRFLFLAAVILGVAARPASASSITVTSDTVFSVYWLNTTTNPDLSGSAVFTIGGFTATGFDLTISNVTNTTAPTPDINARLVSFGFNLAPDFLTSNAVDGSVFDWGFNKNFPNFGTIEVCAFAGSQCASGSPTGLTPGQTQSGTMSVHFTGDTSNGVTFSPIPVKFTTTPFSSLEFDGCIGPCGGTTEELVTPAAVPEPASLVLFGTGLAGVAAVIRRKARRA